MNKRFLITSLLALTFMLTMNVNEANAANEAANPESSTIQTSNGVDKPNNERPNIENGERRMPPPEFGKDGQRPPHDFNGGEPPKFKGAPPSKEEMEAKKAEFEKRLGLTDEQKKKIEQNRTKDHEKVKPIFEEMKAKHKELRDIDSNSNLTSEEKEKKKKALEKDIKSLKDKADKYRKENMKNFESTLNKEQKQEFEKIKTEQQNAMEQRRQNFEKSQNAKGEKTKNNAGNNNKPQNTASQKPASK